MPRGWPLSMHKLKKDLDHTNCYIPMPWGQLNGPPLGEERRAKRYELTTTLSFLMTYASNQKLMGEGDQTLYTKESTKTK